MLFFSAETNEGGLLGFARHWLDWSLVWDDEALDDEALGDVLLAY